MRIARALMAMACVLALAAAVPVAAQTPSPAPAVSVQINDAEGTITVDSAGKFEGTVKNEGTPSGTPLDEQNRGEVTLAVSGVPAGWVASVEPASFELAPGASQTFTLTVSVSADATEDQASITVTATLTSPLEGLDPILGQIPGAGQTATGSDAITVKRDDSFTRDVLETIGPWIYGILLLLVLAVLVAVAISVSSRRTLVRMASDVGEQTVSPGGRAAFPFRVEGLAKQTDTVLLQVSAVQEGWAAFLPVPELTLEPGQVEELTLVVIAPKDAAQQARQAVLVTATSAKAPKGAANLEFVAVVSGPIDLPAASRRRKDE